jgi:predicted metal-dependent HD superfamily phosphohydrolase
MSDLLQRKWRALVGTWAVGTDLADEAFKDISKHYSEPGRFYHTLAHVKSVLETVETLGSHASDLNTVKLAAWLHDVIYDSHASDNEERSAEYAER